MPNSKSIIAEYHDFTMILLGRLNKDSFGVSDSIYSSTATIK